MIAENIIVNARFLTQKITGVQRFAIEISKRIKKLYPDAIFVTPKNILLHEIAYELDAVTVGSLKGHLWEQIELPLYAQRKGNPLLLNLANTAPLFCNNKIVTIHDLAFKVNPKWFSLPFRTFYNFLIPRIAKNSLKVFTVSNSVKHEIGNFYNLSNDKIDVVYNAAKLASTNASGEIKQNLPPKYLLAVSSLDMRKNLVRLINAFSKVNDKEVSLILIGGASKLFSNNGLTSKIEQTENVIHLGYVTDSELCKLYENAIAFIYPSLYEGFGIPNIEAMTFGCPVITSNTCAIKEICGDAALYIDPLTEDDITKKIDLLINNKEIQEELKIKGIQRANQYNWDASAEKVLQSIEATLKERKK